MNLIDFINDDNELEAFLTGPAGSGKTTRLMEYVQTLDKHDINYRVVAFTHKAKEVLESKLPASTPISTLHSWLKKRPGVNEKAKHLRALVTSRQRGKPEHLQLLIVDEFSFVGEADYFSIGELQDPVQLEEAFTEYFCVDCGATVLPDVDRCVCGKIDPDIDYRLTGTPPPPIHVLYVGDLNQLPPVDSVSAVQPHGPYWEELTTVHRTDAPGLQEPLAKLVQMIEGTRPMAYLEPTESLIRNCDIDKAFKADECANKIMLAYTNEAVQKHNAKIQGRATPKDGDLVYNSTLREIHTYNNISLDDEDTIQTAVGLITKDTKYNPFKTLRSLKGVKFLRLDNGNVIAYIFGMYNNKIIRQELGTKLVTANKQGKDSKLLYKKFKVLNDYVCAIDFPHCQTIHKSQGQEFDHVYVDTRDLSKCKDKLTMLKLLYVAMSRAKNFVKFNN